MEEKIQILFVLSSGSANEKENGWWRQCWHFIFQDQKWAEEQGGAQTAGRVAEQAFKKDRLKDKR